MKIHDVEQGSPAWLELRLGRPTASEFDKIVTPLGKLSKAETSTKYAYWLTAERMLNRPLTSIDNLKWVERGKLMEPAALKMYRFEHALDVRKVGFITTDDGRIGASPDGLVVGENAAVELKCPSEQVQMGYVLDGFGPAYYVQVQGQMLVGEFEWVDRYAFHPEMPSAHKRTYRDEPFIAKLREGLDEFTDRLEDMHQRALALGAFQVAPQVQTAHEQAYAGDPGPAPFEIGNEFGGASA